MKNQKDRQRWDEMQMFTGNELLMKALSLEEQGKLDLAVAKYKQTINSGCEDLATVYQSLGRALVHLGQLDEGVEACQEALRLNPELCLARRVMGDVYLMRGEYQMAGAEYTIALKRCQDDPFLFFNFALACPLC